MSSPELPGIPSRRDNLVLPNDINRTKVKPVDTSTIADSVLEDFSNHNQLDAQKKNKSNKPEIKQEAEQEQNNLSIVDTVELGDEEELSPTYGPDGKIKK